MEALGFLLKFLLLVLAVFRLAELLVFDDGPFDVIFRLRVWTGIYDRDQDGNSFDGAVGRKREIGLLLQCPHCIGMWLALPSAIVLFFVPVETFGLVIWLGVAWFAIAGAQSALETVAGRVNSK